MRLPASTDCTNTVASCSRSVTVPLTLSGVYEMEGKSAIGYAVVNNENGMFLGRNSAWYSDIRLATIYAEPRAAANAGRRVETSFAKGVVEVHLFASTAGMDNAKANPIQPSAGRKVKSAGGSKLAGNQNSPKAGTKAA